MKEKCRRSTALMSEVVLGFKNEPHHKEWYEILDDSTLKKIVIAAPRGHSKSTCVSVNFPLNEMVRNPNIRILIVSKTYSQAKSFLREIKGRIERDEKYQLYAGDLLPKHPEKWTDTEIIINRPDLNIKDPTISTVGTGGAILARRADLIICDDILSPENTRTIEQRQANKRWFYEVLLPVLVPGGRLVFVGTVWNIDDLLLELLDNPMYDFRKKYKAIVKEPDRKDLWEEWYKILLEDKIKAKEFLKNNNKKMYDGVEVLWKDKFPYENLFLMRKENTVGFAKSYQNEVLSEESQIIKTDWIRYYKEVPKDVSFVGTGVDLAISQKQTADYTAMVSGKLAYVDGSPKIFIMPFPVNERLTGHETNEKAKHVSMVTGDGILSPLYVEDVAYQKRAIEEMQRAGLPAEGVKVTSDKRARLETSSIYVQNGNVLFPEKGCEDLLAQLLWFGIESHDDLCDAFNILVQKLMESAAFKPNITIV